MGIINKLIDKFSKNKKSEFYNIHKELRDIERVFEKYKSINEGIEKSIESNKEKNERHNQIKESIVETKWYLTQESLNNEDVIIFFQSNGKLLFNEFDNYWILHENDNEIIIILNNGSSILNGRIYGDIISGIGYNIEGRQWQFVATKILTLGGSHNQKSSLTFPDNIKIANSNELTSLLEKKYNWQSFQHVLKENGIERLFHFTDQSNIESIKKYGGLFSWHYCEKNNITIPVQGGDDLSKELDLKYGLEDFVRVSFVPTHPMMFKAKNHSRINNPVVLEISTEICYFKQTRFANMNATKKGHQQGDNIENLNSIHFNTLKTDNYFDLAELEKPYYQAEILVKTWIPKIYITNIYKF